MILDPERLLSVAFADLTVAYDDRRTLLYALACGAEATDLPFVYERGQRVVPSFAQMLGFSDAWLDVAGVPLDLIVHAGLDITFRSPFAPAGTARVSTGIAGLGDKGAGRGGIIHQAMRIEEAGETRAEIRSSLFVRGAGGFGGDRGSETETIALPQREPDERFALGTAPNAAALFRLLGDRNPLHIDPQVAAKAGFAAPILHGAATFGTACLAILKRHADGDPARLSRFAARFTGPVYPGETLAFEVWREPGRLHFRAFAGGRERPALDGGLAVIG